MHNTRTLKLKQLNGIQPSLILLFTAAPFLSSVKKVNCYLFLFSKTFSFQIQSNVFYCAAILSVLMLDEAHERTLYTDIAIGLLKKVIITLQLNFNLCFSSLEKNPRKFWLFNPDSSSLCPTVSRVLWFFPRFRKSGETWGWLWPLPLWMPRWLHH